MQVKIPHKFTRAEAIVRVKEALNAARSKLGGKATIEQEDWAGNMLTYAVTAEGQHISGTLTVLDKEFDLNAKLPLMLKLFEGKIEKMIAEQAAQMIK